MFFKLCSSTFTAITRQPRNYTRLISVPVNRRHYSTPLSLSFGGTKFGKFVRISPEVQEALANDAPVVALDSAGLTNPTETGGIPYPDNIEHAIKAEEQIRDTGATPATIIVVAGFVHVGVTDPSVFRVLTNRETMKVTQRDLPYVVGMPPRLSGGLTISAAISIAEAVGIKVVATGGIGGVHRSATTLMDISSDVYELGRRNVAVVCSGPKVYLDPTSTIEYLETRGVPVATFGPGSLEAMVPAFYSHVGTVKSPLKVQTARDAAEIIFASHCLGLKTGQLFCNPIPVVSSLGIEGVEQSVTAYFKQRKKKCKKDKEIIEEIVGIIRRFSGGRAIPAEKTLLLNNVKKAAEVAVELSKLELEYPAPPKHTQPTPWPTPRPDHQPNHQPNLHSGQVQKKTPGPRIVRWPVA